MSETSEEFYQRMTEVYYRFVDDQVYKDFNKAAAPASKTLELENDIFNAAQQSEQKKIQEPLLSFIAALLPDHHDVNLAREEIENPSIEGIVATGTLAKFYGAAPKRRNKEDRHLYLEEESLGNLITASLVGAAENREDLRTHFRSGVSKILNQFEKLKNGPDDEFRNIPYDMYHPNSRRLFVASMVADLQIMKRNLDCSENGEELFMPGKTVALDVIADNFIRESETFGMRALIGDKLMMKEAVRVFNKLTEQMGLDNYLYLDDRGGAYRKPPAADTQTAPKP
jgi:hypothetical protein